MKSIVHELHNGIIMRTWEAETLEDKRNLQKMRLGLESICWQQTEFELMGKTYFVHVAFSSTVKIGFLHRETVTLILGMNFTPVTRHYYVPEPINIWDMMSH